MGAAVKVPCTRYRIDPVTGCWVWTGGKSHDGYGRLWRAPRLEQAHRVFYEALIGPIPRGLSVDHLCRNTSCVNPAHLEPVTQTENMRRRPDNKLSIEKGHRMRALYAEGLSFAEIGRRFGVSDVMARNVCVKGAWQQEAA